MELLEDFHPSVDYNFLIEQVENSGKVAGIERFGTSTAIAMKGPQALHKRLMVIREFNVGEVHFEQAVAVAIRYDFMNVLLKWFRENKDWKDGGYFDPQLGQS